MEDVGMSILKSEVDIARRNKLIKNGIKNSSSNLVEAERQIVQMSSETRTIHEVLDELRKYGARSKIFQKELKAHFNELFCKDELLKLYKDFKNPLYMEVMSQQDKAKLFCDLEHIMTYNLKFTLNKETGLIEGFVSGGHVGRYTKKLESAGIINIIYEEILPGGARALEYKHSFGSFVISKTEFPLSWTTEDIINSIKEAYNRQVYYKERLIGRKTRCRIVGIGKDNIKIEMFLNKLSDGSLQLKTAYPYWEEKAGLNL